MEHQEQTFVAKSGNVCTYILVEEPVGDEIRIAVDADWSLPPSDSDVEEFYEHIGAVASELGDIEELSSADHSVLSTRPDGATERFIETGEPGIPLRRICPECGSRMERIPELGPEVWVCPACKLLQFRDEHGNMQTRYPHPIKVTGEDAEPSE